MKKKVQTVKQKKKRMDGNPKPRGNEKASAPAARINGGGHLHVAATPAVSPSRASPVNLARSVALKPRLLKLLPSLSLIITLAMAAITGLIVVFMAPMPASAAPGTPPVFCVDPNHPARPGTWESICNDYATHACVPGNLHELTPEQREICNRHICSSSNQTADQQELCEELSSSSSDSGGSDDCNGISLGILRDIDCDEEGGGIWSILNLILEILTVVVGVVAVLGVVVAAIIYTSAGGDEGKTRLAKTMIFNVAIGVVFYVLLFAFLNFLLPGGI